MPNPSSMRANSPEPLMHYARAWGESSFPPTLLATFVTALHMRPFQPLPMIFPPALLFTSYVNLLGYKEDAAGISAAWSGLYVLLAGRRKQPFRNKWTLRGAVRGAAMGVGLVNLVSGGIVYISGKRSKDDDGNGL
ncbi:hypothetical protein D8B26_003501 [Coccidioides posadasii str. Silveira]|uniref:Uncharacterized protein n=3 Tax=Coccidioides posadasii TaxID=199306 RepID=E9D125_COCPS|nr:hypothetical protein CPC735_003300 [Coccidioides posadasii C735 delta SOWgp]EER26161.1 hypothetical protein CPC735_003300 [Coccidioides posadasii C735 delta SOWgp]EFW20029.1 conserved hypothetical protein [Coccidioides posadasii str. Silveira]KMM73401.1 hypothetical protein CPAG_09690 [Coccidioides posadasii RMSCC 3488]QVM08826.1 hypothetical protein D8B26_003501 [Coccidioides posadasii str. Silveira]|eukprot:XP_003068306.1 hypothetical protein CPC735_003300 [Coccidioides posadasii C735 delta SOWgp]